jgi:hypothetical protein
LFKHIPSFGPDRHSKSPTTKATRQVDIVGLVSNFAVCLPEAGRRVSDTAAPFEIA